MLGGIDKTALVQGDAAIEAELARIAPVIRSGGYVPALDHYAHPEISWAAFCAYRQQLAAIL